MHSATLEFIYVPPGVRYPSLLSFPFRALTTPSVKNDAQRLHTRDDEMIEVYACVCVTRFFESLNTSREKVGLCRPLKLRSLYFEAARARCILIVAPSSSLNFINLTA